MKLLVFFFISTLIAFGADLQVPSQLTLQDALNAAVPGDTITIDVSTTQTGNFTLPPHESGMITVRTSAFDDLPNRRVTPADAPLLAKISTVNAMAALTIQSRSSGWRLIGLDVSNVIYSFSTLRIGEATETTTADLPTDIELDRLFIHGGIEGGKRGIELNARSVTIKNCWISNFWGDSQDTQAIGGWNGTGPYRIANNYLEASGENILFGGAPPSIPDLVPRDIRITGNHIRKPQEWFTTTHQIKNLLELKNADGVWVEGNVFENNWMQAQSGRAIELSPRTVDCASWCGVRNVVVRNNIMKGVAGGVGMSGFDNLAANRSVAGFGGNYQIVNNLFDVGNGEKPWPVNQQGWLLMINGIQGIVIDHNTVLGTGDAGIGTMGDGPSNGLVFTNNIVPLNKYALITAVGIGVVGLDTFAPGYWLRRNVLIGDPPRLDFTTSQVNKGTSAENFFPPRLVLNADYSLPPGSLYKGKATDETDIGADMSMVYEATKYAVSGALSMASCPCCVVPSPAIRGQ